MSGDLHVCIDVVQAWSKMPGWLVSRCKCWDCWHHVGLWYLPLCCLLAVFEGLRLVILMLSIWLRSFVGRLLTGRLPMTRGGRILSPGSIAIVRHTIH